MKVNLTNYTQLQLQLDLTYRYCYNVFVGWEKGSLCQHTNHLFILLELQMRILNDDKLVVLEEAVIDSGENAFVILGSFQRNARMSGLTKEEISSVIDEAMSGDYEHLKAVIKANSLLV